MKRKGQFNWCGVYMERHEIEFIGGSDKVKESVKYQKEEFDPANRTLPKSRRQKMENVIYLKKKIFNGESVIVLTIIPHIQFYLVLLLKFFLIKKIKQYTQAAEEKKRQILYFLGA